MARTIIIHSERDFFQKELAPVLARAAQWGRPSYQTVNIFSDGRDDFVITFMDDSGSRFVMGAVWRESTKEFTFHS